MKRQTSKYFFYTVIVVVVIAACGLLLSFGLQKYYNARYPMEYQGVIESYSREYSLPPSFVFAVVHTESRFDPRAVSEDDARGLMQITKDTFDWVLYRMGEEEMDYDEVIFDPALNVRCGTFLLRYLYDEFGSYDLALCAYHAGRGSVNGWLADEELSDDGKTLKKIPFSDTRWYVERVNETRKIYQDLYDLE